MSTMGSMGHQKINIDPIKIWSGVGGFSDPWISVPPSLNPRLSDSKPDSIPIHIKL